MARFRTLFGRRRARPAPSSPAPAAPGTSSGTGGARPTPQRRYLPDVPSLLPNDPLEDQRLTHSASSVRAR
jgi:hypothetical protein